ncbi:MAG: TMEM14 family protein [Isosphaeraceae bacterium]
MRIEHVVLFLYAVLLGVGGVMGFIKARSHASLISGLLSAFAAAAAAVVSLMGYQWGVPLGVTLALVLFVLFGYRYAIRNKKFMPSGVLAVVSLVVLLLLLMVSTRLLPE